MVDSFLCREMAVLNSDGATCHTARTNIGQDEEGEIKIWNEKKKSNEKPDLK